MLKAGFYEKQITPPIGLSKPGGLGFSPSTEVNDELYAKSVVLELDGEMAIIISIDAVGTTNPTCKNVIKRIREYIDIPEENIAITSTHTHTGMPMHRDVYGEFDTPDEAYFDVEERLIADTAILAYQRLQPVTVKFNSSQEKGLSFNRNYVMKDGSIRTNPGWHNPDAVKPFGPVEETFSTLFFFDENDKPIGSIANYSCHSCSTECGYRLSADYSGILSQNLRDEFGRDFVTVFLLGTAGNINHYDIHRESQYLEEGRFKVIGNQLAEAAVKHLETATEVKTDILKVKRDYVPLMKQPISEEAYEEAKRLKATLPADVKINGIAEPESDGFKRRRAQTTINIYNIPEPVQTCVQTIRLGECTFFILCGEIYCEYGFELKEKSPAKYNFIATKSNGSPACYMPIPEARGTNIYEASLSSAWLEDRAGDKVVAEALKQVDELYK